MIWICTILVMAQIDAGCVAFKRVHYYIHVHVFLILLLWRKYGKIY